MSTADLDDDDPPAPQGFVASVGALALSGWRSGAELFEVSQRTIYWTFRGRREPGVVLASAYEIGNRSLFFLSVTMGFIGMILVYQSGLQALRVVPDLTLLGATFLEALVRDLAASLGAMMLATRVGAGIAAEIGSMVVTEQVDALRMSGVDPVHWLIVPRFLASLVMTTALIAWAGLVSYVAGGLTAHFIFDVQLRTYFDISLVSGGDLAIGVAKCVAYGAAIPVVSGWCGLTAKGGSEGVGWATTRAVVNSSLAVIVLNFFISGLGFIVFPT